MTLYDYTAMKNPQGASQVIASYGVRPHGHPQVMAKQLAQLVRRDGERALKAISDVHPDLQLFQGQIDSFKEKIKGDSHSNACGCSNFANADGQTIKSEVASIKEEVASGKSSKDMLIMGGIIVLGLALILRK